MMKKYTTLFFLIATLSMSACVKLGGEPIEKHYYRITPARTETPPEAQCGKILKIRRLSVSDIYNTRELVYQMSDGRIESDFYNMLFVAPGNMLTSELRKWLAQSGHFANVIEPGSMVIPDLTLEGVVNSLYGDYSTEPPNAVIAMQFFLVDESTPNNEIVFSSSYRQRIPLDKSAPDELVQGMTKGIQIIFTELELDLAKTVQN